MQDRVRRFRALAQEKLGEKQGRGVRYPEALRQEAVACVREGLSSGASLRDVASRLGLGLPTLSGLRRATRALPTVRKSGIGTRSTGGSWRKR